jgi:hypothetical protein
VACRYAARLLCSWTVSSVRRPRPSHGAEEEEEDADEYGGYVFLHAMTFAVWEGGRKEGGHDTMCMYSSAVLYRGLFSLHVY